MRAKVPGGRARGPAGVRYECQYKAMGWSGGGAFRERLPRCKVVAVAGYTLGQPSLCFDLCGVI